MTKQQKTYLLLVAVLVVWGLIGFRIYRGFHNDKEKELDITPSNNKFVIKQNEISKDYVLKTNYRDPFLGKLPFKKNNRKKTKRSPRNKDIPFPNIIYNGVVEGGDSKSYTITINGKQELVKVGDNIQIIKLIKATPNKIVIRFQGKTKTIQLQ